MASKANRRRGKKQQARWNKWLASPWPWMGAGVVVLALAAVFVLSNNGAPLAEANNPVAQTANDFTLPTLDGSEFALSSHRGEYVLVNFWATWCPPCRAELPDLQAYYQEHAAAGFAFVAVNAQEDSGTVSAFMAANNFDFPVALDGAGQVMNRYRVQGLPSSYLINPDGEIVQSWTGMIDRGMLESEVTPLLANGA